MSFVPGESRRKSFVPGESRRRERVVTRTVELLVNWYHARERHREKLERIAREYEIEDIRIDGLSFVSMVMKEGLEPHQMVSILEEYMKRRDEDSESIDR